MSFSTFAAFWTVSFLFVITPGADWAYAITAGLQRGVVVPAVGGLLSGHMLATAVVAAGVGGLVTRFPMVMLAMTLVGACYLIWLGINVFRHPSGPRAGADDLGSGLSWAIKGACLSGLNPKVFLLFLALLPQFIEPDTAWPISTQILLLGSVHTFSCAVIYLLVGFGAKVILRARPRAALLVSHFSGAAMMVVGLLLLIEQTLR
ncbi:MAG: LysE family translocator [Pseudomonas sp.]|nr:MAG: LysE family translocator [Pseudomonas sp.]